jgi:hypothetical protein
LRKVVDKWGRRSSPPDKETLLKQYELIREEVTTSLQVQQQILSFAIATIGLLAGALFVSRKTPFRSELLVVFLPVICYLALTVWFSEVMRMRRAGGFLLTLEKKLDTWGDGSLEWEYRVAKDRLGTHSRTALRDTDPDGLRLVAVTLLFFVLGGLSIRMGWDDASAFARIFAVAAVVVAAILLLGVYWLRIGEWNDLLEVDPEVRRVALEIRILKACRRLPSGAARLARRIPRPRTAEQPDRFALDPLVAQSA